MKSLGHKRGGGSVNLRGKRHKRMRCGCCTMVNVKPEIQRAEDRKEIRRASQVEARRE